MVAQYDRGCRTKHTNVHNATAPFFMKSGQALDIIQINEYYIHNIIKEILTCAVKCNKIANIEQMFAGGRAK